MTRREATLTAAAMLASLFVLLVANSLIAGVTACISGEVICEEIDNG